MTDSRSLPGAVTPPTDVIASDYTPECPNCGQVAEMTSVRGADSDGVLQGTYVCGREHIWVVRWFQVAC